MEVAKAECHTAHARCNFNCCTCSLGTCLHFLSTAIKYCSGRCARLTSGLLVAKEDCLPELPLSLLLGAPGSAALMREFVSAKPAARPAPTSACDTKLSCHTSDTRELNQIETRTDITQYASNPFKGPCLARTLLAAALPYWCDVLVPRHAYFQEQ